METFCQLEIAKDLGYITEEKLLELELIAEKISKMLSGLTASIEKSIKP